MPGMRPFPGVENPGRRLLLAAGWGALLFLALSAPAGAASVTVQEDAAHLRAGPGVDHPLVDKLARGERVAVLERRGQWLKVQRSGGGTGWVFSSLVSDPDGPVTDTSRADPPRVPASPPPPEAAEPGPPSRSLPPGARDNILRTSKGDMVVGDYRPGADYVAVIDTDRGRIVVELWPDEAPNHVKNFIRLCSIHFYDGLTIHRIVPGFVIQGGDPRGDGTGGPGYTIALEPSERPHALGVLSMARRVREPDSAGSQFFILLDEQPFLDGRYSAFGTVIRGMDIVRALGRVPSNDWDQPLEPIHIRSMRVLERSAWEKSG